MVEYDGGRNEGRAPSSGRGGGGGAVMSSMGREAKRGGVGRNTHEGVRASVVSLVAWLEGAGGCSAESWGGHNVMRGRREGQKSHVDGVFFQGTSEEATFVCVLHSEGVECASGSRETEARG